MGQNEHPIHGVLNIWRWISYLTSRRRKIRGRKPLIRRRYNVICKFPLLTSMRKTPIISSQRMNELWNFAGRFSIEFPFCHTIICLSLKAFSNNGKAAKWGQFEIESLHRLNSILNSKYGNCSSHTMVWNYGKPSLGALVTDMKYRPPKGFC